MMNRHKKTSTEQSSLTKAMIERGKAAFREAFRGSAVLPGDRQDDEALVTAIYEAMEAARLASRNAVPALAGYRLDPLAPLHSEAEVTAAIEETLEAFSNHLEGLDEPEISSWNRDTFVDRVRRHLRKEQTIDPCQW